MSPLAHSPLLWSVQPRRGGAGLSATAGLLAILVLPSCIWLSKPQDTGVRSPDSSGADDTGCVPLTWYRDEDQDGYGLSTDVILSCESEAGYVSDPSDCDDGDAAVHPGADELCNEADDDCDGEADDGVGEVSSTWYVDGDGDGYGSQAMATFTCPPTEGYADNDLDCDDNNAEANPATGEVGTSGGWPKLAALKLNFDGDLPDICEIAARDLVVDYGSVSDYAGQRGESLVQVSELLHTLNANQVLVRDMPFVIGLYGVDPDPTTDPAWSDNYLLSDSDGVAVDCWGIPCYVINYTDSDAREFMVNWLISNAEANGRWSDSADEAIYDGIFVDIVDISVAGIMHDDAGTCINVDFDRDGVVDDCDEWNSTWRSGIIDSVEAVAAGLSSGSGQGNLYLSGYTNDGSKPMLWDSISGFYQPYHWVQAYEAKNADAWLASLYRERSLAVHFGDEGLAATAMSGDTSLTTDVGSYLDATDEVIDDVRADYARERFGVVSSLLAGAAFSYEWGEGRFGLGWWYDEFDGGGLGIGYLGAPTGDLAPYPEPSGALVDSWTFAADDDGWESWGCTTSHPNCTEAPAIDVESSWSSEDADGGTGSLHVEVDNVDDELTWDWADIAYIDDVTVAAGQTYVLTLSARSSEPRILQAYLQNMDSDTLMSYTPVFYTTSTWQTYYLELTAAASTAKGRVSVFLGTEDGEVWLDNLVLREGDIGSVWRREFERGLALVNVGDTTQTVVLGTSFQHLTGHQDTDVNNDEVVTEVSITPWDGVILRR